MSKHKKHPHGNDHHRPNHAGGGHGRGKSSKMIHHDWRFWVAIVLMLLAMVGYVLSLDESVRPGEGERPEVPALAE